MNDCIFCKIINKEIDSNIIYEDDKVIAILDIDPICDGHTLIIPKKHITDIYEVDNETLTYMFDIGKKLAKKLIDAFDNECMTFSINFGEMQAVKHIHLHLVPNVKKKPTLGIYEVYNKLKD